MKRDQQANSIGECVPRRKGYPLGLTGHPAVVQVDCGVKTAMERRSILSQQAYRNGTAARTQADRFRTDPHLGQVLPGFRWPGLQSWSQSLPW
jgi:hypothetical protein